MTRWTLYALGAVEGHRVRRPRDPVAAWFLRRHPKLQPAFAAPSILSMIRARATIVDRMIEDEVARARSRGGAVSFWGFGGGFDARWFRLQALGDGVRAHCEVEEPDVLDFKNLALSTSTFAPSWQRIHRIPVKEDRWTVHDANSDDTLVVLEGVASRLGLESCKRLLGRIRRDVREARVIVDLPGILPAQSSGAGGTAQAIGSARSRWASPGPTSAAAIRRDELERLGWTVLDDVWLAARPEVRAPSGISICSGMEALRVMKLAPLD
ncbi:MAG: class I SAM-dependent methyltransferase [Myxococcota bacterium]